MPQAGRAVAIATAVALVALAWTGTAAAAKHHKRHHRRARARAAVVVPAALAAPVAAVSASATPAPGAPFGRVELVTDRRAYLDRGAADGLVAGQALPIARTGRPIGSCTLEVVGDHEATCTGHRLRVGDTFRTARAGGRRAQAAGGATARAKAAVPVPSLPPVIDDETLQARAAVIADAAIEKVEFNGRHAFHAHSTAEVAPGFVAWFTQPNEPGGGYAQERIDGVIRGVELGRTGFRFDGAFSAVRWTSPAAERFRAGSPTQFYLWEAEVARRRQPGDGEGGTTIAVGRLWPYHTPGLTLLDGVQLGRQNQARTVEGGVYGGLIPAADSLAPGFDIWAAGLYGALAQLGDRSSRVRLARQELRVGVWRDTRTVTEAQGLAQSWIGPVTAGAGGRVRWSPDAGGGVVVEQASVDIGVRPSLTSGAGLHARYQGATLLPDAPLRAELLMPTGGVMHAIADGQVELSSRLGLAGSAGAHRESVTGRRQLHAGAEARFPRLFRETGGLWVGAEVEQGWMQGENVYAQFVGHGSDRVRVLVRLSVNGTRFETPTAIWNLHELGGYANVDGVLTPWLRLRAWTLLRAPILVQGVLPTDASFGAVAGLSLAGAI